MKFFTGLLAGLATAFFVAWGLPAIVISAYPQYRFDAHGYFEVFVHRHHNVVTWFERGWPESIIPVAVILAPFLGGLVLHLTRLRGRRAGTSEHRDMLLDILLTAFTFASFYFIGAISAAAIAEHSHPYPFLGWSYFFGFQGMRQMVTLFALAAAMSALGAYGAELLGWVRARRQEPV